MSDLVFLCAVCLCISLCLMFYNNVKKHVIQEAQADRWFPREHVHSIWFL